jgi:signal transduction histidine kinase
MGAHMLPGRERWRATRRSIRFTVSVILAVPVLAGAAMWGFAGATIGDAIARHGQMAQHGTVLIRIALADAVGLLAVLIAAVAMGWFARRLFQEVSGIEVTARRFADQQFPQLVERLRRGDHVDLDGELPAAAPAKTTEVARAAAAVASIQRTAITAAATETSLRTGISQVFVSLARRSQSLLQRQLRLLDELESKAAHPAALADLFPLDHLTTRMRRHAEGLIILSGSVPGRGWSSPVPVIDVIRGAIAEVEDYKRVAVVTGSEDMVAGSAVADMIHLLAELIENAALFSPSGTRVEVRAERVGNGFAFEIEDRGLGIKPDELDAINERLGSPADFDLANADQLGLFVVGKLAARHGVRVFLRHSPYGGTTAIVLVPNSMITPSAEASAQPADGDTPAVHDRGLQLALTGRPVRPGSAADHKDLPGLPASGAAALARPPGTGDGTGSGQPHAGPAGAGTPAAPDAPVTPDAEVAAPVTPAAPAAPVTPDTSHGEPLFPLTQPTFLGQRVFPGQTGAGGSQPDGTATEPAGPRPPASSQEAGMHRGLPRRVRQANMSPHLRARPSPGPAAPSRGPETRSPEQARRLLASLQSGWERGRRTEEVPDSRARAGGRNPGDGRREVPREDA